MKLNYCPFYHTAIKCMLSDYCCPPAPDPLIHSSLSAGHSYIYSTSTVGSICWGPGTAPGAGDLVMKKQTQISSSRRAKVWLYSHRSGGNDWCVYLYLLKVQEDQEPQLWQLHSKNKAEPGAHPA